MTIDDSKVWDVANRGEMAFWTVVAESYPEIKEGDLAPHTTNQLMSELRYVIREWLVTNAPKDTEAV